MTGTAFDPSSRKVLVVEDEPPILSGIKDNLEAEGYKVLTATDGQAGLDLALAQDPDLVILDVMMPKLSGFDVLKKLRENRIRGAIIMLTAKRAEEDTVKGLKLGADDYIGKPFKLVELLARVQAVLRRTEPAKEWTEARWAEIHVNFKTFTATKKGVALDLTPRELKILKHFIDNPEKVVSRNEFLDKVWGYDAFPTTRTVDNHIVKLRKAIEDDPEDPKFILSVRGVGYKFAAAVQKS